jgi:hypothetical protein
VGAPIVNNHARASINGGLGVTAAADPLTIDQGKILKEGILRKKGNHLYSYRFKKKYYYLVDHYLKFGSVKGHPINQIDLSTGMVEVVVSSKYRTQFKIVYYERGI